MIYKDGYPMDSNLRVTACPLCRNEEFSDDAEFCRIYGTGLYNNCEGQRIYDDFGNYEDFVVHKNPGNARFCEKCGAPIAFAKANFLRTYLEVRDEYLSQYTSENPDAIHTDTQDSFDFDDFSGAFESSDSELPF